DGADATGEDGSTAQIAKWLAAPVVLVMDVGGQSRSAAATVAGFERFDPALTVAAVIANRVGGEIHGRWIAEAVHARWRAAVVGAIPRDDALTLAERHLGLVTAAEGPLTSEFRDRLATVTEASVDLDRLRALASTRASVRVAERPGQAARARIGVARDVAFQFYYEENLTLLRQAGAELVFWSPLCEDVP